MKKQSLVVILSALLLAMPAGAAEKETSGIWRPLVLCGAMIAFVGAYASRDRAIADYERAQRRGEAALVALPFSLALGSERGTVRSIEALVEADAPPPNTLPQKLLMGASVVAAIAALAFPRRPEE